MGETLRLCLCLCLCLCWVSKVWEVSRWDSQHHLVPLPIVGAVYQTTAVTTLSQIPSPAVETIQRKSVTISTTALTCATKAGPKLWNYIAPKRWQFLWVHTFLGCDLLRKFHRKKNGSYEKSRGQESSRRKYDWRGRWAKTQPKGITSHFPNHENKSLALLYEEIDEEVGKYRSSPSWAHQCIFKAHCEGLSRLLSRLKETTLKATATNTWCRRSIPNPGRKTTKHRTEPQIQSKKPHNHEARS